MSSRTACNMLSGSTAAEGRSISGATGVATNSYAEPHPYTKCSRISRGTQWQQNPTAQHESKEFLLSYHFAMFLLFCYSVSCFAILLLSCWLLSSPVACCYFVARWRFTNLSEAKPNPQLHLPKLSLSPLCSGSVISCDRLTRPPGLPGDPQR